MDRSEEEEVARGDAEIKKEGVGKEGIGGISAVGRAIQYLSFPFPFSYTYCRSLKR